MCKINAVFVDIVLLAQTLSVSLIEFQIIGVLCPVSPLRSSALVQRLQHIF